MGNLSNRPTHQGDVWIRTSKIQGMMAFPRRSMLQTVKKFWVVVQMTVWLCYFCKVASRCGLRILVRGKVVSIKLLLNSILNMGQMNKNICWIALKFKPCCYNNFAWCVFVRASLHMRREEKPTRCHCKFYCIYDTLNMFRALLCPLSGALD